MRKAIIKYVALGLFALAPSQLLAAPDGFISYKVKPADTLYHLTKSYLVNPGAMDEIRRINRVRNPRLMQIGKTLRIPRRLLKHKPAKLSLESFSGKVDLVKDRQKLSLKRGVALREGVEITTGRNSFARIAGDGNSSVAIPSNSRVRIVDARRYLINDQIDVQVRVLEGRGEVTAPKIRGDGRYRVGTPIAVTAVRGTEFRVGFVPGKDVSLTEVVEGNVVVAAGDEEQATAAGFGLSAAKDGLGEQERLLPAPQLIDAGKIQTEPLANFNIEPVAGAAAYRTQLSTDAGFIDIVSEVVGKGEEVQFSNLEDGRYFIRSRAISEAGLEGFSKGLTFRRKRAGVEASAEESSLADAFKFAWRAQGEGEAFYAFQLWDKDNPGKLIVDELGLRNTAVLVSNLDPGTYRWKTGSFQIDEGDVIKVWGPVQELSITQ
ncbi:MAG: FecR domain-containing protein [Pseudomonadota bacterium]